MQKKKKPMTREEYRDKYRSYIPLLELDILKSIKILSDASSLEIFINDGEEVFTTRIYDSMSSLCCGMGSSGVKGTAELFELKKR